MEKQFGVHGVKTRVTVNHATYLAPATDYREHSVELRIDLDRVISALAARACRSKGGRSIAMGGAIIMRRVK